MRTYENLILEQHGSIAIVTLNRPDSLNAFNRALLTDLGEAVTEVNTNDEISVVILTGSGRSFCAGADLAERTKPKVTSENLLLQVYKPILMDITNAPKPWISAVNGAAAGVGSAFAMNCDLTVMAENAYIYQAFAFIGLIPDGGATWHLTQTLGRKLAYELIATGEKVSASKCKELGLCNRVVDPENLMGETIAWAQELATRAPLSLRYAKQSVNTATNSSLEQTIIDEATLQAICSSSEDAREGIKAFLEKRAPQWKGR
jgi:2-(1,2-epoxy-1,2-dihydrophenyl)acetyl-CoA isomerase